MKKKGLLLRLTAVGAAAVLCAGSLQPVMAEETGTAAEETTDVTEGAGEEIPADQGGGEGQPGNEEQSGADGAGEGQTGTENPGEGQTEGDVFDDAAGDPAVPDGEQPQDSQDVEDPGEITDETEAELTPTPAPAAEVVHVTVHDPSIIRNDHGEYYVLGSHTASARSLDMAAWEQVCFDYGNPESTPFYGNLQETFAEPFRWAGYDDGDCAGGYAVWAPDIIWDPRYVWVDGSTGAYLLYVSTSSTWRRSCICYLVSKDFQGPYAYRDTLVYSGFTKTGEADGNSTRDTKWDNDYLNLNELLEKGSEGGGIDELSDNWFDSAGGWNSDYAPNAIDPNLFFDAAGEHLYMSYGSWCGGLFILELDPSTGEAIYPGADSVDEASGNFVDRYFGVHIAGGNNQSGEGPYIQYDPETGYYYLYETYGGPAADGGYNMRLFRSLTPYGPYMDAAGGNAADSGADNDSYGSKLMGNYSLYGQVGKRAAGHNSVLIDEDGSRYLVYHQRFETDPQLEAHEVRVHQQFLNEDLWPVPAVYEYRAQQPENYEAGEVAGFYEFICHGKTTTGEMEPTQILALYEDGTLGGARTGTWTKTDSGRGYDFVTFTFDDGTVYKGYFFKQNKENADPEPVMTFSALGNDNRCIWGSMIDMSDTEMAASMASLALKQMLPDTARENLRLPASVMSAEVTWSSSDPAVISETGVVTPREEDVQVELTAHITCGDAVRDSVYEVTVREAASLICGYDFQEGSVDGTAVAPVEGSALTENAVLTGEASIADDVERGRVLSIANEEGAKGVNYLRLPEDTLQDVGPSGYSVAMWVKIGEDTLEDSALFEADAAADYPLTRIGANLITSIHANASGDVQGNLLAASGQRGVWEHVVCTVDAGGIRVYLNGELAGQEEKDLTDCFRRNETGISQARDVMVGSGFIRGDEDCRSALFDDVRIYKGALTAAEVQALYAQ